MKILKKQEHVSVVFEVTEYVERCEESNKAIQEVARTNIMAYDDLLFSRNSAPVLPAEQNSKSPYFNPNQNFEFHSFDDLMKDVALVNYGYVKLSSHAVTNLFELKSLVNWTSKDFNPYTPSAVVKTRENVQTGKETLDGLNPLPAYKKEMVEQLKKIVQSFSEAKIVLEASIEPDALLDFCNKYDFDVKKFLVSGGRLNDFSLSLKQVEEIAGAVKA